MSIFKFNSNQPDQTVELIKQIPAWTSGYDAAKTTKLSEIAQKLSAETNSRLRNSIKIFTDEIILEKNAIAELSKVFLLLRVLFELPESMDRSRTKIFGGWFHPSVENTDAPFNLSWPVSFSRSFLKGNIQINGQFRGYKGRLYDAVGEFDYFNICFRRRRLK